jgi:hypothetical protein
MAGNDKTKTNFFFLHVEWINVPIKGSTTSSSSSSASTHTKIVQLKWLDNQHHTLDVIKASNRQKVNNHLNLVTPYEEEEHNSRIWSVKIPFPTDIISQYRKANLNMYIAFQNALSEKESLTYECFNSLTSIGEKFGSDVHSLLSEEDDSPFVFLLYGSMLIVPAPRPTLF